jgi:hypothetical protein
MKYNPGRRVMRRYGRRLNARQTNAPELLCCPNLDLGEVGASPSSERSSPLELRGEEKDCCGVNHFIGGAATSANPGPVSRIREMSARIAAR